MLDGLSGDARAERAELVDWLLGQGIGVEEIRNSFAPMLLPARRALGDDGTYVSARQISERTGLDLEPLMRFQRAAGLPQVDDPDAPVFMRPDGDTAVHIKRFLDLGIDPDQMLAVVRVLADGLANAAEVMRGAVLGKVLRPGVTELEIAQGSKAVAGAAAPLLGPMIEDLLLLQLRHAVETEAVNANERAVGAPLPGARVVAAAFADLVGFTRLGEEVPPEELEKLANRLGELAREVAVAPVRFIKTIGDAVMFVSADTGALLDAVLRLIDAAEADELLPQLRAGVAFGPAVSRAGDWFGSPVNTASRVTSVARPGSVLVSEAARESVGEDPRFSWSAAGSRHLRGIRDATKLFRARRVAPE
ncbi:MAG TPA: adenylate/guanylate cyclase domain-containing protein [Mycobacterium sp.]|nr:adenylate/guanylate cyclase domain-containing protein [Mycobacterium sp.]